jgi:mannose-6-phosphate isomerase-like protein (cupin superfamily)
MKGYHTPIEEKTLSNTYFRHVLFTGANMQLVLMALKPREDIGLETHEGHDQFFRIESGIGEAVIGEDTFQLKDGDVVIVPAGEKHNIVNTSDTQMLKLYTIYAPPEHPDGTIHKTKEEAGE